MSSHPITGYTRPAKVQEMLGVSHPTLWRWCRDGLMPKPVKLGPNTVGFPNEPLADYMADPAAWRARNVKAAV